MFVTLNTFQVVIFPLKEEVLENTRSIFVMVEVFQEEK